ncbi:MAG: prenyltransferase/squalene oxidase repeat-containing protein [Planctomycetota bacterium]|jgi:hypothetical protein
MFRRIALSSFFGALALNSPLLAQQEEAASAEVEASLRADQARFMLSGRKKGASNLKNRNASKAVKLGLDWLADHQNPDGRWDADAFFEQDPPGRETDGLGQPEHDVGITGLVLLTFLADGNTPDAGAHRKVVSKGLQWLDGTQDKGTMNGSGFLGESEHEGAIYDHLLGSLAIIEAYGMSGGAELQASAQLCVDYIRYHRTPESGWRYEAQGEDADGSVTALALQVLSIAQGMGLNVHPVQIETGRQWLMDRTDEENGRSGYLRRGTATPRRDRSHERAFDPEKSEALTASALYSHLLMDGGVGRRQILELQTALILELLPDWSDEKARDLVFWNLASQALWQMGGEAVWEAWSEAMQKALISSQRNKGTAKGSWDPEVTWGVEGGRLYSTAMALLCLQAEYRYARLAEYIPVPNGNPFKGLARAWSKRDYAKIPRELEKVGAGELSAEQGLILARARLAWERQVEHAKAEVEELRAGPLYVIAKPILEQIEAEYGNLDVGKAAASALQHYAKDKKIQRELKADEAFAPVMLRAQIYLDQRKGKKDKILEELQQLIRTYKGTRAAELATPMVGKLSGRNQRRRR